MIPNTHRCEITHGQILFGVCPWCDVIIGKIRSDAPRVSKVNTRWYSSAVAAGIQSDDATVRDVTLSGLCHGWQLEEEMLAVFAIALAHTDRSFIDRVEFALHGRAFNLSSAQIDWLERCCEKQNIELPARILLAAACQFKNTETPAVAAEAAQVRHVLWLIERNPRSSTLGMFGRIPSFRAQSDFESAKKLWQQHLAAFPDDVRILKNAGLFYFAEDPETSLQLQQRVVEIQPDPAIKSLIQLLGKINSIRSPVNPFDYWKDWKRDF
jgi:hypothetical protein